MSINDNGFPIINIPYTSEKPYISQGAVIGIAFGWLVGIIGFYVLGMLIIRYYFKRHPRDVDSDKPKNRKASQSSNQPPAIDLGLSRNRPEQQQNAKVQKQNRRRVYEQNPTIEMINVTQQNETYKNMAISSKNRKNKQNFSLDQKLSSENN